MSRTVLKSKPPSESAAFAGLRYVTDDPPGIRRQMGALGFRYYHPDDRPLRGAADLKRIRALAIPPAWTRVWICQDPKGHLQATGRDARGRKQYRYHRDWLASRDGSKFDRLEEFAAILPFVRRRIAANLAKPGLPREKVLAAVVQLLERSLIRVGNERCGQEDGRACDCGGGRSARKYACGLPEVVHPSRDPRVLYGSIAREQTVSTVAVVG
jgi:DNA topoisomerase-1